MFFFIFSLCYSSSETHGRIVNEVAALFKEIWCKPYAHIASIDFRNAVGHYHSMFSGPDHQDSHEFLRILIDWMHLDLETLHPVSRIHRCSFKIRNEGVVFDIVISFAGNTSRKPYRCRQGMAGIRQEQRECNFPIILRTVQKYPQMCRVQM